MQICQRLVLIHLCHSEFLNQKLFYFFQLIDFLVDFLYFHIPFFNKPLIIVPLLIFYHPLALHFHLQKLSFALVNIVSLLPFPVIVVFFLSYSPLKELFLLCDHHPFHPHCSLLDLKFAMLDLFIMHFFHDSISLFLLSISLHSFHLPPHFILKLPLMPISSFQQLLSFLISYLCQLLGPLLLEHQPLNTILQKISFRGFIFLEKSCLQHIDALAHCLPTMNHRKGP